MTTGSDGYPPPGEPFQPPLGEPRPAPHDGWAFGGPAPAPFATTPAPSYPAAPMPDYLGPASPRRRSRRRLVLVSLGTAIIVLIGGGAFAAYDLLNGGGPQPEQALPGNVVGYAEVDLDPAAGQKINAYRLARKFPDSKVTGEKSLKDDLLRQLFASDGGEDPIDYDKDIKPWVGDRAGVAVLDELDVDDQPVVVAALQYKDRAKAEAGLKRLAAGGDGTGYAFGAQGYVVIADSDETAQKAVKDAEKSSLADNKRYNAAIDELGGDQVAVAWADLEGIFNLIPKDLLADAPAELKDLDPHGSFVVGASVDSDAVEVRGKGVGLDLGALGPATLAAPRTRGTLVTQLPADSLVAASVSGLGDSVRGAYQAFKDEAKKDPDLSGFLDSIDEVGLALPSDLTAVLGDESAFTLLPGRSGEPGVGGRSIGGDPQRGLEVIAKVIAYVEDVDVADVDLSGIVEEHEGGLVAGSSPRVLAQVAKDGKLGDTDSFRNAVPDADAPAVVYVHVAGLLDAFPDDLDLSEAERRNVAPLDAVGLTARDDSFTLRVTFS